MHGHRCFDGGLYGLHAAERGKEKVYSVDVGYGQFAWKLRQDPLSVWKKQNIRYVTPEDIDDVLDFASVDVSFISLTKSAPGGICTVKGRRTDGLSDQTTVRGRTGKKVGKKGVVRDKAVHEEVIERIITFALENGFSVHHLEYSPRSRGPEGNIEYLVHIEKNRTKQ